MAALPVQRAARFSQGRLVAGIDWGGGGRSRTVLVVGYMRSNYQFQVCYLERFSATEDPSHVVKAVAKRCAGLRVGWVAADGGGNGHVLNRLLLDHYPNPRGFYAIGYAMSEHEPYADGVLTRWMVHRSASIGALFTRVKKKRILFPRLAECSSFLEEFACELAEYDDKTRTVRYTHPDSQQDDALHATNYALLLAVLLFAAERRHGAERDG